MFSAAVATMSLCWILHIPGGVMSKTWLESFMGNRPLLYKIIGRFVRPDEIEDIVQETFLHSYAASRKQAIHNPRAFLARTARNIALNHIELSENRLTQPLSGFTEEELAVHTRSLEEQYQSDETFLRFCRAVAILPSGCRRVFILRKVYGLSQKEIAERLTLSQSTVEKHVARGMLLTTEYMAGDEKGRDNAAKLSSLRDSSKSTGRDKSSAKSRDNSRANSKVNREARHE